MSGTAKSLERMVFERGFTRLQHFFDAKSNYSKAWQEASDSSQVILFATPEYNSSIPGQLKNAVDWASRPVGTAALRNKPAAVIGASTGMFGAVWAQAELRKALAAAGARVIDRELPVPTAEDAFNADGTLVEPDQVLELEGILVELEAEATLHTGPDGVRANRRRRGRDPYAARGRSRRRAGSLPAP